MQSSKHRPNLTARTLGSLCLCAAALASPLHGRAQTPQPAPEIGHARLWQAYANRFISADGRVLDPQGGDRTTSEGQSYALFFSLVNNDRAHFDKLLAWTESNLAANDLGAHLPAWDWGKAKDGHWGVLDPNSASDSDLWIAYDLIEAGRLWNDLHYVSLGHRLAALIARREVTDLPGFGPAVLPAAVGFKLQRTWILNPAYTPLFILNRLATVEPEGPWANVAMEIPSLLARSAVNGFAMDWVCYSPGKAFTPCLKSGQENDQALGSYESIRVYLWTGMLSDSNPAKARILKALPGMNLYLEKHAAPPEKVNLDGVPMNGDGPVGFSAALLPYLSSIPNPAAVAQQQVRIKSQLDEKSNLYGPGYGTGPTYYDQNLVLFGSGWMEKQFQFGSSGELLVRWTR